MYQVSVVSYLNTAPFVYGLKHNNPLSSGWNYSLDIPAVCAQKLLDGICDVGLVPVAILPKLGEYHLIGDTCIGADGAVDSVVLLHEVPLEEINSVALDYQSRTSVNLCRLLMRDYWKKEIEYIDTQSDVHEFAKGTTAAVLIGDRVFEHASKFTYVTDLSKAWKDWTGLPFVFAAWVSRKKMPSAFTESFNQQVSLGLKHMDEVIAEARAKYPAAFPVENYLRNKISYTLNKRALQGMETFLTMLGTL
ncbi:MAG: menaquinone biosynthesis protein [Bacteroidetes bacterium]|nr:menaquinone biosynthesis protein [Bacteroidota bacterium]